MIFEVDFVRGCVGDDFGDVVYEGDGLEAKACWDCFVGFEDEEDVGAQGEGS